LSKGRKTDIANGLKINYIDIGSTLSTEWRSRASDLPSGGMNSMMSVEELELAVDSLTREEYSKFRRWFLDRDWEKWDHEIEEDADAGRLDFLIREATEAKNNKRLTDL
jgi:hypothetical protein